MSRWLFFFKLYIKKLFFGIQNIVYYNSFYAQQETFAPIVMHRLLSNPNILNLVAAYTDLPNFNQLAVNTFIYIVETLKKLQLF